MAVCLLNHQLHDASDLCDESALATILLQRHSRVAGSKVSKVRTQAAPIMIILRMRTASVPVTPAPTTGS